MRLITLGTLLERHSTWQSMIIIHAGETQLGQVRWLPDGGYRLPEGARPDDHVMHRSFHVLRMNGKTTKLYYIYI